MPDMYKDKYLEKTKFQTWLHAYPGTIQVHIWNYFIYLGNTAKYPIWVDRSKKMELVQFPSFTTSTLYAETEIFNIQIECRKRFVA
jgi:hypothetical protein